MEQSGGDSKFLKGQSPLHMQNFLQDSKRPRPPEGRQAFDNAATCCCLALRGLLGTFLPEPALGARAFVQTAALVSLSRPFSGRTQSSRGWSAGSVGDEPCSGRCSGPGGRTDALGAQWLAFLRHRASFPKLRGYGAPRV